MKDKKEKKANLKFVAYTLFEIGTLRKIPRAHMQSLMTSDISDNISSHMFRVTWIGWFLAQLSGADPYKVLMMCMLHDLPEARSGDQNWVHKKYVKVFEDEIINEQLKNVIGAKKLLEIQKEYQDRKTLESKIAKDADLIDQMMLLKEHSYAGNKEAENWLKIKSYKKDNRQYTLLSNKISRDLASEILKQKPSDWWNDLWSDVRR